MNFGLFHFWLPLIAIIRIYYFIPCRHWRNLFLLTVSWVFYILVDWRIFPCLLISTLTDYIAGFLVTPKRKKILRLTALCFSLFVNLSLLFIFKYMPELLNQNGGFASLLKSIGLPLGISFYTFQTISYTIDCYRGHIKPSSNFLSFALYVSFFPQLAAGPIEKAKNLLPQFQNSIDIKSQQFREGFYLVLLGLFKKVYVAGALLYPLQRIYETDKVPPGLALLTGLLAGFYIYADFSSYSDLARGIAKFFGVELMVNFKPFIFARNPKEFWKNWHISLYQWILDYLMKPIVKNLKMKKRYYVLILFVVIGLWHKASLNWLLFGVFNAFAFLTYSFWSRMSFWRRFPDSLKYLITVICMFFFFTINGLLYYSENFEVFLNMISRILRFRGFGRETFDLLFYLFPFLSPLLIYEWFQHKKGTELFIMKVPVVVRAFWIAFVLSCIFIFERNTEHTFIYFGF